MTHSIYVLLIKREEKEKEKNIFFTIFYFILFYCESELIDWSYEDNLKPRKIKNIKISKSKIK